MMNEDENVEIGLQEEVVEEKRRKNCSSKKYEHIIKCLDNKTHPNMLYYTNDEKTEFKIVLMNKKNRKWSEENISLCADLDRISSKSYDVNEKGYAEKSRGRLNSNLRKLKKKYLTEISNTKKDDEKSLKILKFKIREKEPVNFAVNEKQVGKKTRKRMGENKDGPLPCKMMRTATPLVLPVYDVNNFQNIGANPLSASNLYIISFDNSGMRNNQDTNDPLCSILQNNNSDMSTLYGWNIENTVNANGVHLQNSDVSNFNRSDTVNGYNANGEHLQNSDVSYFNRSDTVNGYNANGEHLQNSDMSNFNRSDTVNGYNFSIENLQNTNSPASTSNDSSEENSDISEDTTIERMLQNFSPETFGSIYEVDLTLFDDSGKEVLMNSTNPCLSSVSAQEPDIQNQFSLDKFANIGDFQFDY